MLVDAISAVFSGKSAYYAKTIKYANSVRIELTGTDQTVYFAQEQSTTVMSVTPKALSVHLAMMGTT